MLGAFSFGYKWHQNGTIRQNKNPQRCGFIVFSLVEHTGFELV